jgi:hypothetical protein
LGFVRRRDSGVDLFGLELVETGFFGFRPGLLQPFGNQVMLRQFAEDAAKSHNFVLR